ncbi:anaerobic ribonucleoside-triphosphate reductase activating protein [Bacillota bacterium]
MRIAGIIKSSLIDFPNKTSTVIFIGGCNFRCGYCHNPELVDGKGETIDPEDFFAFLIKRKRFIDGVCISGGEPTLNSELPAFIERIKILGFSVKLDTNGSNPVMLEELMKEGLLDYAAMDIKGPEYKYHLVAGRPVDLMSVKASAGLLTNAYNNNGFLCEFRTTVCREQLGREDLTSMVSEYPGHPPWYFQSFRNPGSILDNKGSYSAYSTEEMEEMGRGLCVSVR